MESMSRRRMTTVASLTCAALVALATIAIGWALPARAQESATAAPPKAADLVQASARPVALVAGGSAQAQLVLRIAPGWHVNANPPSPDYLIPTTVALAGAAGVSVGRTAYPPGTPVKLGFDENPLSVYSGQVSLRIPLSAAPGTANGARTLAGQVRFQSCNDQVCLAPASVPFALAVTVSGGGAPGAASGPGGPAGARDTAVARGDNAAATPPGAGTTGGPAAPGAAQSDAGRRLMGALAKGGLWWFLALFVGGLALNLTPCVFPMLGITVSVFGARRRERPLRVLTHAVAYVLGIAVTYSVLGVVAALTGGLFGSALQNPFVNVGLGALFLVLALSMFGLYEMQPPPWMLERLGGADATSLLGIFLSGLAVGVIAAPCVGPFVVAVLALLAQRGDPLFGFETMFAMSLGLGFPYLFLALFSNLLQSLPRSGDWMLWVKKVFGVLLSAIGLYYVLVGLAPRWAEWVLPAALVLGGLYLGFVDRHGSARRGFRAFKWALGVVAVVAGVSSAWMLRAEGVRFRPYDEAAVQAALAAGTPVMLDFSADWCVPCHELDRGTFTDRRVIERSRDFAAFKVDLTRYDAPGSKQLRARFGVTGVPEVLFFLPGGGELRAARVIGFLPPEPFLERMEAVRLASR
jgi:thiol:disulfide interchange protein DsbD